MGGLKTISIIVAANIKGLETGLGKANSSLAKFASGAARMGSLLTFAITAPLAALGKAAVNTFVEFEDSMMKVNVVTGATAKEFEQLTNSAKDLGAKTRFTARQFSDLQLTLGRKGFDPSQILAMEEAVAKLALATGEDLNLAANVVANSLNAFNLESDESARIANTLASAAANSSVALNTFSTAFGHAGSSAHAVGVDIEELSAMMGVLMDNGIKASKAGTGLRKIFSKLNEVGKPFNEVLTEMASGEMTLNDATKLVGETASNQLLILSNQLDKVNELTEGYRTNTGVLDDMAEKMSETTKNKIAVMNSALEAMNLVIGDIIVKQLLPLINKITELATAFTELEPHTQRNIVFIGELAAAIGVLLLAIAAISAIFAGISLAFTTFAGGAVGGAVIAVVGTLAATFGAIPLAISAVLLALAALSFAMDDVEESSFSMLESWKEFNRFTEIQTGISKAKDDLKELIKVQDAFILQQSKNIGARVTTKRISSVGNGGFIPETGLRGDGRSDVPEEGMQSFFGFDLGLAEEQIVGLNESIRGVFSSMASGFVDIFDKQTRFVEINGVMIEETLTFGEKFGSFVKDFLIGIAKMIIQTAILAGLLMITGLGGITSGLGAIGGSGFGNTFMSLLGGSFANGGSPPVGKMSLVGEQGPELFVPNQSGTIIPNGSFGGGGATHIPNVTISGDDLLIVFDKANRRKSRR